MRDVFSFLPEERVLLDREDLLLYAYDATPADRRYPAAVVRPTSREEVVEIVRAASRRGLCLVARGAGTSLSGAPLPREGCVVVDFTLMNKIIEVDEANAFVAAQPGVVYEELNRVLAEHGLFFPPDPGSGSVCTLGGMVAMNSSGIRAVKYGTTRDYVASLEVVLASGEVLRLGGRYRKSASGYDLKGLFVGSEGTLGLFTEIGLRLVPKPSHRAAMIAGFHDFNAAAEAIARAMRARTDVAVLEVMDSRVVKAVEGFSGIHLSSAEVLVLAEVEGFDEGVEGEMRRVARIFREAGAEVELAHDEAEIAKLWKARKAALPALARLAETLLLEDITVPVAALPEMMRRIGRIAERHGLRIATFGHAGDGNLHPTFLLNDEEELERARAAVEELFRECLALGGTLSGEHGIGVEKRPYFELEHGKAAQIMRDIKRTLDPQGIMNPGKIF
ncbi:MAG: FAD-binding protein [Euryarchaeota archaeon]|nr:FAD-binding protein [Euryarchaeota archaeon]